jgi:hypothetical protein
MSYQAQVTREILGDHPKRFNPAMIAPSSSLSSRRMNPSLTSPATVWGSTSTRNLSRVSGNTVSPGPMSVSGKRGSRLWGSVHAAGEPLLRSAIVRMPTATARSPQLRRPDQNFALHSDLQKRCGEPPRRGRNGFSHHRHVASAIAETPGMTHMTQRDAPTMEAAIARACMYARVEGLSWEMRHGASCVTLAGTHHRAVPARFPRPHPSRSRAAVMRR